MKTQVYFSNKPNTIILAKCQDEAKVKQAIIDEFASTPSDYLKNINILCSKKHRFTRKQAAILLKGGRINGINFNDIVKHIKA